jgi:hypothetical protein
MRGTIGRDSLRNPHFRTTLRCRLTLRVFRCLPVTGVKGRTEAGVRKAWKEETAGAFAATLVSIYGEFAGAG